MTPRRPFTIRVPDETLTDLRMRLDASAGRTRSRRRLAVRHRPRVHEGLVAYWREHYDWRAHEARLNRLQQFAAPVEGIDLHFIHEPGVGPAPLPLLLSHGWPGSIVEFERMIPMLTDPGALRRRPGRRLHRGRAVAARLRLLVPAEPAALRRRRDRRHVRRADDRRARLPALRARRAATGARSSSSRLGCGLSRARWPAST